MKASQASFLDLMQVKKELTLTNLTHDAESDR